MNIQLFSTKGYYPCYKVVKGKFIYYLQYKSGECSDWHEVYYVVDSETNEFIFKGVDTIDDDLTIIDLDYMEKKLKSADGEDALECIKAFDDKVQKTLKNFMSYDIKVLNETFENPCKKRKLVSVE